MRYVLGKPIVVGRFAIAIVSRQVADARSIGGKGVAMMCHKEPAFVVVQDGQRRAVLDMMGAKVSMAKIEALCPALVAFSRQ
jgi:hypothetical protein